MTEPKPRLIVGPANIPIAPDFVLIDSYAKAIEYFGERNAQRYRAMFEDAAPLNVLNMSSLPPTQAELTAVLASRYQPEPEPEEE